MAAEWTCKWRWESEYSADSVEWCPVEQYRDILVCGTYQLKVEDEELVGASQKRLGKIYLFKFDRNSSDLTPLQTISTSGILDLKWCHHSLEGIPVLGAVTADGFIQLYRLVEDRTLKMWISEPVGENVLALSMDWSTNKVPSSEPSLVVSDSSGIITMWKISGNKLEKSKFWKAHDYEAWVGAFNYWNSDIIYSGGDDCLFKIFDARQECPAAINRTHAAGVTAIRSHVDVENILLTGSYDEKVRLWDTRNLKTCVTEKDVNGGVWRLKWNPYKHDLILAACMYGGFRILRNEGELSVLCEYVEHESIAYGADWQFQEDLHTVATCSFYDCMVHISEITLIS